LLADGRVLIAGGYVLAKDQTATFFSTVELYDPTTNRWSPAEPMSTGRTAHTATSLSNGDVLVVGGQSGRPLDTAERYNPHTNVWTPAGQMSSPRTQHQAVALMDGQVLVAGGQTHADNAVPTAAAERYDPSSNRWSVASSARSASSALL
jgi:N-acetylneuraminic acid mutarotase